MHDGTNKDGYLSAYWLAIVLALAVWTDARAAEMPQTRIESRRLINDLPQPADAAPTHVLNLRIANIGDWNETEIITGLHGAARILMQCRIRIARAELLRIAVVESHRHFDTPRSRELARTLALPAPVLYFAAGTRQNPAFDAEAIGRGNSRSRPELRDSVWIARGAQDLQQVIAHELAHVLMDSGTHDNTPGNLMAEDSSPHNTQLTAAQCAQITATGTRNGLLQHGVN